MTLGRLRSAGQFERVLRSPVRERSAHFAVHHVPAGQETPSGEPRDPELSTEWDNSLPKPVDEMPDQTLVGCVLPKRHARRAVMRNVIKRQLRAALQRVEPPLAAGWWLVRLRAPFPAAQFRSADSAVLRRAVRDELDRLLARCCMPARRGRDVAGRATRTPESGIAAPRH